MSSESRQQHGRSPAGRARAVIQKKAAAGAAAAAAQTSDLKSRSTFSFAYAYIEFYRNERE